MEPIEDLSFSNIVNIIDKQTIKAGDVLAACALELQQVRNEIDKAEASLAILKSRESTLLGVPRKVYNHLKLDYPLFVSRQNFIAVIEEDSMTITRNII